MVKIVSDELITQINDQLKAVVEDAVKKHIENIETFHSNKILRYSNSFHTPPKTIPESGRNIQFWILKGSGET